MLIPVDRSTNRSNCIEWCCHYMQNSIDEANTHMRFGYASYSTTTIYKKKGWRRKTMSKWDEMSKRTFNDWRRLRQHSPPARLTQKKKTTENQKPRRKRKWFDEWKVSNGIGNTQNVLLYANINRITSIQIETRRHQTNEKFEYEIRGSRQTKHLSVKIHSRKRKPTEAKMYEKKIFNKKSIHICAMINLNVRLN